MDLSKFKPADWLIIAGAIGVLIFGFLPWETLEYLGETSSGTNVFTFVFTGIIPWVLLLAAAVAVVLLRTGALKADAAPWPWIFLVVCGVAAGLLAGRVIFNPTPQPGYQRGIGMILSFVASLVSLGGAILGVVQPGAKAPAVAGGQPGPPMQQYSPQHGHPQQQYPPQPGYPQQPQQQYPPQPGYPQQPQQQYPPQQQPPQQYPPQPGYPQQPPQQYPPQQPGGAPPPPPPPGSTPPPPPPPNR